MVDEPRPRPSYTWVWIVVAVVAVSLVVGVALESRGEEAATSGPPGTIYVMVSDNGKVVTVETDSADPTHLRAVFDQIRATVTSGDMRAVSINCTTGGTASWEHRLANGAYAMTTRGKVQIGADTGGEVQFAVLEGASCP